MTFFKKWRRSHYSVSQYLLVLAVVSVSGYGSSAFDDSGAESVESAASSNLASGVRRPRHSNSGHNNAQQERRTSITEHRLRSVVHKRGSSRMSGFELAPLYEPFADWDPPPLEPGWWHNLYTSTPTQHKAPQRPMHELCAASRVKVYMPDVFGHMNNVLLEYAHLLHYCLSAFDPLAPATMLLPRAYRRFVGLQTFDVRAATASWACVDLEVPSPPLPQLKVSSDARTVRAGGSRITPEAVATASRVGNKDAPTSRESSPTIDSRANVARARAAARAARAARAEKKGASQSGTASGELAARRLDEVDSANPQRGRATAEVRVTRPPKLEAQPSSLPSMRLERHNATEAYFDRLPHSSSHDGKGSGRSVQYEGSVLAQLVLRPSSSLRQLVEEFESSLFTPVNDTATPQGPGTASSGRPPSSSPSSQPSTAPQSYVVIHLRAFGPSCHVRVKRALERQRQTITAAQLGGRNVETRDLCGMSTAYIDAAIAAHARSLENSAGTEGRSGTSNDLSKDSSDVFKWPVVLAHDGEDEARAAAIVSRYGARVYRGPTAPFVDLLLMVRAGLFIGNPASSFSTNAARVRYAVAAAKVAAAKTEAASPGSVPFDPATNLRCGGAPGLDPAQC